MNSSDKAVEAFIVDVLKRADIQRHIPLPDDERAAYDDGGRWEEGAQAVRLVQARKIIAAVRAEAVADERVRAAPAQSAAWYEGYEQGIVSAPGRPRSMARNRAWEAAKAEAAKVRLAAGSVPVATPERWALMFDDREYGPFPSKQAAHDYGDTLADADFGPSHEWNAFPLIAPVATPPAEPAEKTADAWNWGGVDTAPAPSQPVTCEEDEPPC